MYKPNKNQILIAIAVLAIAVTGGLVATKAAPNNMPLFILDFTASPDAVAKKALDYINKTALKAGQSAELVSASKESGVVKMKIKVTTSEGTNTFDSYASLDGKLLFPEAFSILGVQDGTATDSSDQNAAQITPANVAKVETSLLNTYIVSNCPYGLQIQRAIAGAVKAIPELASHITMRYIGAVAGNTITAMHGVEEAQENLRQICIRDEQKSKYWDYVSCYMKKATGTAANGMPIGDGRTCQAEAGINVAKLDACVADVNRGVAYAKEDFDLATKELGTPNVASPTLVLNGQKINETPFGGRSADSMRNIICSSSIAAPGFCDSKLDTAPASASFSLTYAPTASVATAAANNICPPAAN